LLDLNAENTVFRRYNTAVVVTFIIIVFIALAAASLRYYSELTTHKQQGLSQLNAQAYQLNTMLLQSEQAISGIQEFAHYVLKYPHELNTNLVQLKQNGEHYYLDKPRIDILDQDKLISANITGFGHVSVFSALKSQEIAMANALTPAFVAAQKVIEEATWFYYVSFEQFVSIFPWIDRESWHFSNRMLTNPHIQKIQQSDLNHNQVTWSSPYIDASGKGMNAALGIGVYRAKQLLGAIVIDINLARLQQSLPELDTVDQGLVLFNQNNEILFFKQKGKDPLSYRSSWQKLLPQGLDELTSQKLADLDDSTQVGDWLVEKKTLSVNGWTLLKYQPYANFISPLRSHFVFMFAILLVGLLAFLMLVNAMTRRSFIKPTHQFIRHIEYCAQGDPGKVKANADWLHWFVLVEDIFTQNRSLLLQLKEQNEVLDSRVLEKTQALQETSAKHQRDYVLLRSVMNAIPELIIFNDPQGKLMGCNQAFELLTRHLETEMLGYQAASFMPEALAKEIDGFNEYFNKDYPQHALLKAGNYSYQGYCNQFTNKQGEVLGSITILQDVTEQQATQSALEKAKNQAEYANQVKIQFLANMSHEIRTPINAMQGMMDLLNRTVLNSRQQHYLANAQTASFSLLHLIDELLDLSKIEAGKMLIINEEVNLAAILNKALKLNIEGIHSKKLQMKIELGANVPTVINTDEMRLIQVVSNLLNNAIKFTEQGEVALYVDKVGERDTNVLVRFKVKDTGIGIARDKQGYLFEAFSQADISMTRKYGGSGLGLSICQQIVKLLGGEISLESDLGQGCEFSFILPFSMPTHVAEQKSQAKNIDASDLSTVLTICTIGQNLSATCLDTIDSLAWHYQQVTCLEEIIMPTSDEKTRGELVLLIDEIELTSQILQAEENGIAWQKNINLIGLCHPTTLELNTDICQKLDSMSVAYILLDTPLYRYSLDNIANALSDACIAGDLTNETQVVSLSEKQSSPLPAVKQVTNTELDNINVLLVEDNLVNQLVAKELLLSMQAKVTIADNGQRALDLLSEHHFDVVLMDIQMPVMDGLTAASTIRKQEQDSLSTQAIPIIAMTAHAHEEDKQRSLAAGMNLHIAKPVTGEVLHKSILQVIKNSQLAH
jgi:signal transduction histidine kinase/ActR/RegA family two-component response regulator